MDRLVLGNTKEGKVSISLKDMEQHMSILGSTGTGKSFLLLGLLWKICMYFGVALIDPKGSTSQEFIARLAEDAPPSIRQKIIYLDKDFSLDPLYVPDWITGREYTETLSRKIDLTARAIARIDRNVDFSQMSRKYRHTTNFLWMVGVRRGKKAPLGFATSLRQVQTIGTNAWNRVFASVNRHLPKFVSEDLLWVCRLPKGRRELELDSTISGLRKIITVDTMPLFSSSASPVDFEEIMQNEEMLICDFGPPRSREVSRVLSHIVFGSLLEAAQNVPRERTYYVALEEAPMVLGADIRDALLRARGFNMSLILLAQSILSYEEE